MNENEISHDHDVSGTCCQSPGLTMQETDVRQLPDGSWRATRPIGTIFGAEVQGECRGVGDTREAALAALKKEQDHLYESLWI